MLGSLDGGAEDDHLVVVQLSEQVHQSSGLFFLEHRAVVLEQAGEGELALVVDFDLIWLEVETLSLVLLGRAGDLHSS